MISPSPRRHRSRSLSPSSRRGGFAGAAYAHQEPCVLLCTCDLEQAKVKAFTRVSVSSRTCLDCWKRTRVHALKAEDEHCWRSRDRSRPRSAVAGSCAGASWGSGAACEPGSHPLGVQEQRFAAEAHPNSRRKIRTLALPPARAGPGLRDLRADAVRYRDALAMAASRAAGPCRGWDRAVGRGRRDPDHAVPSLYTHISEGCIDETRSSLVMGLMICWRGHGVRLVRESTDGRGTYRSQSASAQPPDCSPSAASVRQRRDPEYFQDPAAGGSVSPGLRGLPPLPVPVLPGRDVPQARSRTCQGNHQGRTG